MFHLTHTHHLLDEHHRRTDAAERRALLGLGRNIRLGRDVDLVRSRGGRGRSLLARRRRATPTTPATPVAPVASAVPVVSAAAARIAGVSQDAESPIEAALTPACAAR